MSGFNRPFAKEQPHSGARHNTCVDCGAEFPTSRMVCHVCGGAARRPRDTVSVPGSYMARESLPPRLRAIRQEDRWDMQRMRERVEALRAEDSR